MTSNEYESAAVAKTMESVDSLEDNQIVHIIDEPIPLTNRPHHIQNKIAIAQTNFT